MNLIDDKVHIIDVGFLGVDPFLNSFVAIEGIFIKFFPVLDYFMNFDANHDPLEEFSGKFAVEVERCRAGWVNWLLFLFHCKMQKDKIYNERVVGRKLIVIMSSKRNLNKSLVHKILN